MIGGNIGDDFQGFGNGVDLQGGHVVELDPADGGVRPVAASFEAFVRAKIAELA